MKRSFLWSSLRGSEFILIGLGFAAKFFPVILSSDSENAERKRMLGTRFLIITNDNSGCLWRAVAGGRRNARTESNGDCHFYESSWPWFVLENFSDTAIWIWKRSSKVRPNVYSLARNRLNFGDGSWEVQTKQIVSAGMRRARPLCSAWWRIFYHWPSHTGRSYSKFETVLRSIRRQAFVRH